MVAFLNIAAETTQRVLAEREAQAARTAAEHAEGRLRGVFAQAPAFVAVLRGKEHVFEFVNDAYLQLVGHRNIIGKRVIDALPELRAQGFVDLLDEVYRTGEPFVGRELPVGLQHDPGGPAEEVYLDFVYQPLIDEHGERVGTPSPTARTSRRPSTLGAKWSGCCARVSARGPTPKGAKRATVFSPTPFRCRVWTATPESALPRWE